MKEKWSFSFEINVKELLNQQHTKIHLSQKQYCENFNITDHIDSESWKLRYASQT